MKIIKKKVINNPEAKTNILVVLFSSLFFTGYIPSASGTFGTIASLLIFFSDDAKKIEYLFPLTLLCFIVGVLTSNVMMKKYGKDPSVVVIDEAVGMWISVLVFLALTNSALNLKALIILFLLFRFFDIIKLQPAKYFDDLDSGFGIMMDDVVAGIYAGLLFTAIFFLQIKIFL